MASSDLGLLHPKVRALAGRLLDGCKSAGIDLIVTSTLRTFEEQDAIYAVGRTKPGQVVTKAKGGQSWHNYGLAFDVAVTVGGKAVWSGDQWRKVGEIGEALGLTWGGRWKFKDLPHFEYHPGLRLQEALRMRREGIPLPAWD